MGNTYTFNHKSIGEYKYTTDASFTDISGSYKLIGEGQDITQFNDKYYSDETIDSIIHDITITNDRDFLNNRKHSNPYLNCMANNDCKTKIENYNRLLYKDNLKNDPNLNLDQYSKLKYLEEEVEKTSMMANEYYMLLYIWFIIMIILLFVFVLTLFSSNNEINPIVNYIVTIFFIYCIYQIYKNIYY